MGRACGMHAKQGKEEKFEVKNHLEDQASDGKITLRQIVRECIGRM